MYHGEVNIFQDQLESFLITAELLQVKGLTDNLEEDLPKGQIRVSENASLDLSSKSRLVEDIVPVLSDEPINLMTIQPVREEQNIPQATTVTSVPEQDNGNVELTPQPEIEKIEESGSSKQTVAPIEDMQVDTQTTSAEDLSSEKSTTGKLRSRGSSLDFKV